MSPQILSWLPKPIPPPATGSQHCRDPCREYSGASPCQAEAGRGFTFSNRLHTLPLEQIILLLPMQGPSRPSTLSRLPREGQGYIFSRGAFRESLVCQHDRAFSEGL